MTLATHTFTTPPYAVTGSARKAEETRSLGSTRTGMAALRGYTQFATASQRAHQAAATYRRAATDLAAGKAGAPGATWLMTQTLVCHRRAQAAADESARALVEERDQWRAPLWTRLASAYAWADAHLTDALGAPQQTAPSRLHNAADRLTDVALFLDGPF